MISDRDTMTTATVHGVITVPMTVWVEWERDGWPNADTIRKLVAAQAEPASELRCTGPVVEGGQ